MNTPDPKPTPPGSLPTGLACLAAAAVWACVAWAVYCYYLMGYIPYGLILLPVVVGLGVGLLCRAGTRGLSRHRAKLIFAATVLGCVLGDFVWIKLSNPGRPIGTLLGSELASTLRTLFALDKLLFYAITSYLACAVALPPKRFAPD